MIITNHLLIYNTIKKMEKKMPISDNQVILILLGAFITGILALRLGNELYQ
uniref:Photosystem I reaction center subunit XII n=1 Tax=Chara vulgaris TaxID=55564 RepID=Q1ACL8_CHAVU|nr:M polypeptide of photosystem I [Chara vulgaris]ABA61927.1 M polypeptide of photosystem I [Chara vulgaris]WAP91303.1 M polypeptide of photosystem I [Chara vulgaris]